VHSPHALYLCFQSWGQSNLTWSLLPQTALASATNTNPTYADVKTQAYAIAQAANKTQDVDFDAVLVMIKTALGGPMTYSGGYAELSGQTAFLVRRRPAHKYMCVHPSFRYALVTFTSTRYGFLTLRT
jgi:hypothetical protein